MFLVIADVLSGAEVDAARDHLNDSDKFGDGRTTAGSLARTVKNNQQADGQYAAPVLKKVESRLLVHPVFRSAARPRSIIKLLVSRYRPGMAYGTHVDNPLMEGQRTDLSFTLFLTDPASCEGGELVIEGNEGERSFKLPAGSLVLYPATTLHHVNEVTAGERLAVVGWVRSLIRHDSHRELLFDLDNVLASLPGADRSTIDRLQKVRANLVRLWAED
jgi:PKHD-type hydroxylase